MKLCFPVASDNGLASAVYDHFGSARRFVLVDTETGKVASISNEDVAHVHGACNPVHALGGTSVDAVVVSGIGQGALAKLNRSGIKVFTAQAPTVAENVELYKNGSFQELAPKTCGGHGHGHGHGCSH